MTSPRPGPEQDYSAAYKRFVLLMLTIVYALNFIDRQILVILQEPIKAEMGLSDAQLGLLSGFAFAVIYVTAGIPIAYWADRRNRRRLAGAPPSWWSGFRAWCSQSFFDSRSGNRSVAAGIPLPPVRPNPD